MITNQYPPYHRGGDAIQCQLLSEELIKNGYDISVIYDPFSYEFITQKRIKEKQNDKIAGVNIYALRSDLIKLSYSYLGFQKTNLNLLNLLRKINPDIIHFHNSSAFGWSGFKTAYQFKRKTLITIHDTWIACPLRKICQFNYTNCVLCQIKNKRIPTIINKHNINYIQKFIFPSKFIKDIIIDKYPNINYSIIPNGVPSIKQILTPNEIEVIKIENQIPKDKKVGIFIGILKKEKGFLDILKVLPKLHNIFIIFIGEQKEIIEPNKESGKLFGFIKDKIQLGRFYSIADFFILPSYSENIPLSILEAMSCGLPIISSNIGGIPEIISQNIEGILITPGNIDQLYDAIDTFQHNESQVQEMSEASYNNYLKNFSINIMINNYKRVYSDL